MRWSNAGVVLVLAVLGSCGKEPDGAPDTDGVAAPTQHPNATLEETAPAAPRAPDLVPPPKPFAGPAVAGGGGPRIGFAGEGRFVVFSRAGEPSFTVLDRDRNGTFTVLGAPAGEEDAGYDVYVSIGLARGVTKLHLQEARGRMLVRSIGGVQLVDLAAGGRMLAAWRGEPHTTSIAPDGASFHVDTDRGRHIVRGTDGAFVTFASSLESVRWGKTALFWIGAAEVVRVDRTTLRKTTFEAPAGEPWAIGIGADADVVAVSFADHLEVHTPFASLRVTSPKSSQIRVKDDGTMVAWVEHLRPEPQDEGYDEKDKGWLHTLDLASEAHARGVMEGSGCSVAPERIESIEDGAVVTDASCSIGCPSVRWDHRTVKYDLHTAAVLSDTTAQDTQSYNEAMNETSAAAEKLAATRKVSMSALMHRPGKVEGMLAALAPGLSLEDTSLEDSRDITLDDVTFSPDGTIVAGIVGGRARAWDASTGQALLR